MTRAARRARRGFTLISVLIAVVMLSVGLLALAKVQTSIVRTQRETALRSVALSVARSYVEEIRSRDPWTLASEAPVQVDLRGQVAVGGPLTRRTIVIQDAVNLLRITVQVDYPGQRQPVQLITMAYRG
ncbi:MAG TPA: prepilin-type N-terminal cleavage/methylation domain-containing protein [Gemmatimonadales bacterium]|jgi:type IV pilus assembly protein PilV